MIHHHHRISRPSAPTIPGSGGLVVATGSIAEAKLSPEPSVQVAVLAETDASLTTAIDRQVRTCLSWGHGRRLRGARHSGETGDPGRTSREGWSVALRALHPLDDEARPGIEPAGDLAAPRRLGIGRTRHDQTAG